MELKIELPSHQKNEYILHIDHGLTDNLPDLTKTDEHSNVFLICDEYSSKSKWVEDLRNKLPNHAGGFTLPGGEQYKTLEMVEKALLAMKLMKCDRKTLVVNIGGGMTGDFGGLVASLYMRGVDFVQVPTTLLAQIDASVGGKVGVNLGNTKNLVGSYAQPKAVIIDTDLLQTLPTNQLNSGMAEVIKHAFIASADHLKDIDKYLANPNAENLASLVAASCRIKADVVMSDPSEKGRRKILNFGHTIGHAIEALSHDTQSPLLHGEAVALGMIAETYISERKGMISSEVRKSLVSYLQKFDLPTESSQTYLEFALFNKMQSDKKNVAGEIKWTLLEGIGQATFDCTADEQIVKDALHLIKAI